MTIEEFDKRYDEAQRFLIILHARAEGDVLGNLSETQVQTMAQQANETLTFLRECAESAKKQIQGEATLKKIGDWLTRPQSMVGDFYGQVARDSLTIEAGEGQ